MADREQTDMDGGTESPDSATFGNRPATGARLVDHAGSLSAGFGGGQEATDFLGLSQELAGLDAGADRGADAAASPPSRTAPLGADASASWLLSRQERPEDATESEDGVEEPEEIATVEKGRSRRILSLAAAALVVGAAFTIAMKLGRGPKPSDPALLAVQPSGGVRKPVEEPFQLASPQGHNSSGRQSILPNGETVPVAETQPDTETATTAAPTEPVASTMSDPGVSSVPDAPEATPVSGAHPAEPAPAARVAARRLSEWMSRHGWSPIAASGEDSSDGMGTSRSEVPSGWSLTAILAFGPRSPLAIPAADSTAPTSGDATSNGGSLPSAYVTSLGGDASHTPLGNAKDPKSGTVVMGAVRTASAEDLAGIWNANVVPMDSLDAETRIVTPAVGNVRVVLDTGEIFDGRLYAVGQGQVWLETDIGRLALSAKHVIRIDQSLSDKDAKVVNALPRMRVRTPGGLFFGRVIARDDRRVTLMLEGGGRITLESTDVEAAPLGDTRVIGPAKP